LTLTLLFSGAVFIILAGTIRAITILTVNYPTSNISDDHRLIFMYLVWSGRRKERQLMGMPRDICRYHRDKPTHHPPSASSIGPSNRSRRSSEQKQQIAVSELPVTEWRRSRKSKGPEPENAHASALYSQRHCVGQR
jgi:hypothetical protein